ncbi:MAG TPA: hypothetical protein DGG94_18685 [Micromonosporaceae bacterium]|nr:hypothetical protein [Micromonosporaceae bacterium]HCU51796.1 hypothetical protein [Micromonosporaceae bacterium]
MSVATKAPPGHIRLHRAPLLDPPFDDELLPTTYRPVPYEPQLTMPSGAVAGASPECHTAALKFLNFCLELFNGFRSPAQMRPLIALEQALAVLDELARGVRKTNELRKHRQDGKVRRSQVRTCEPRPGAAEVSAVLNNGSRTFAMCYRLERCTSTNRWRCTYLKVIL